MTEDDLKIIGGLVAGMEVAVVNIGNVLDRKGVIPKQDLADSFKATAEGLPGDFNGRALAALVLERIARHLEGKAPPDPSGAFLTLIQGGKSG